ncbi:dihydrodipicolinate synthase family protein [Pseudomonadota bacterium]
MNNLEGVTTPVATPIKDGEIDIEGLGNLTEHLVTNGCDTLFGVSTTSEALLMNPGQKETSLEVISRQNKDRVKLIAGVPAHTLKESKALITSASKNKAEAIVIAPLYGEETTPDSVSELIEISPLPVILYNNPGITNGENVDIATIIRLSAHPKVIGIKDSSGDEKYFQQLLQLQSQHFAVLQGRETPSLRSLKAGASGLVSGSANVYPKQFKTLYTQRRPKDLQEVLRLKKDIASLPGSYIHGIKIKLVEKGIIDSAEML